MDDESEIVEAAHADWIEWATWAFTLMNELVAITDRDLRERRLAKALARGLGGRATLSVGPKRAVVARRASRRPGSRSRARALHLIDSTIHLSDTRAATILLRRRKAQAPFSEIDARRLAMLHAGCAWVHAEPDLAPHHLEKLSPREREAAQHFVDGRTEKEVAAMLGRSRHTVHAYVKRIYRTLGVRSRAELGRALRASSQAGVASSSEADSEAVRRFTSRADD